VKADAQNARASEATVRGKLASAEADLQRAKETYSEQRMKPDGRPRQRNRHKRKHKVLGSRGQRPKTNSLMRKRLERQPKSEKKLARTLPKANQVSAADGDRGLGTNRLIPKSDRRSCTRNSEQANRHLFRRNP
jgi:hypothetical protein